MARAIVLQHAEVEGAGRIADLLRDLDVEIRTHTLRSADDVPDDIAAGDLLVVMGGSMGVADVGRAEFPYLTREVELLQQRIAIDAPVLGVCLGAQLLAHAAGARVAPMKAPDGRRLYEVGWASIRFHHTPHDGLLAGIPDEAPVVHWHGDAFELPTGARLLASSDLCCQGFQLGQRQFGLQFHCELDSAQIEDFLREDHDYVITANGAGGVERVRRETPRHIADFRALGERLLTNILRQMLAP